MPTALVLLTVSLLTVALAEQWDCNRPWPALELFLPINTKANQASIRIHEWRNIFLRSFLLFWPLQLSQIKLLIVTDIENKDNHIDYGIQSIVNNTLREIIQGGVSIQYNNIAKQYYHGHGHDRQQLLMFWPENYTSTEYIGYVDTDCLFLTYVDREDLFEDGKPVVNGRTGNLQKSTNGGRPGDLYWQEVAQNTWEVLGIKETMRCMSYFPVIVKNEHMRAFREHVIAHIQRKYNESLTFDEIFAKYIVPDGTNTYSQFNLMCTYLYDQYPNDYKWYVHDVSPEWDKRNPPPMPAQNVSDGLFTKEMYRPKPRIASHANYRNWGQLHWIIENDERTSYANLKQTLQEGVCFSPPFPHDVNKDFFPATERERRERRMLRGEGGERRLSSSEHDTTTRHRGHRRLESVSNGSLQDALHLSVPASMDIHNTNEHKIYSCRWYNPLYNTDAQIKNEWFQEMHTFEMMDWTRVQSKQDMLKEHVWRNERIKHCSYDYNKQYHELNKIMRHHNSIGDIVGSSAAGRALYQIGSDFRLHNIPDFDTFLAMKHSGGANDGQAWDLNEVAQLASRAFRDYEIGEPLKSVDG